jgi:dihydroorotate dehydrogenase electron transfer subunit
MSLPNRDTIFLEEGRIQRHLTCPGKQHVLRLEAPRCAAAAAPGSFVYLRCDPLLAMRRPFSIMRSSRDAGWIEVLYKVVGRGTRILAQRRKGDRISCLGPIGKGFSVPPAASSCALLIGGGVGIPPMIFQAERLRDRAPGKLLVLMGSEVPFPFSPVPSRIVTQGIPDGTIAALPLLEERGIPSRLASLQGYPGCYQGYVTDLAERWIGERGHTGDLVVYACGPHAMLEALAGVCRRLRIPCQISLEEYMACAVGGCAGCVVEVETAAGTAMKRVCVDGPVFEADTVFPA